MRWLVLLVAIASACGKPSHDAEKKQWADKPPPKDVPPPTDLKIDVIVDGRPGTAITATTLAKKPDFEDAERSAWLVATLVPEAAGEGAIVEATGASGVSIKFARPGAQGVEPVLFLTRRGDVIVSAIDPKDPFPAFHGQGQRLHRPGDASPRVGPVTKLAITRGK